MKMLRLILSSLLLITFTLPALAGGSADKQDDMQLAVQSALRSATEKDPGLKAWIDSAAAYAVFPKVGKAGIGIGGARGHGLLIQGDKTLADVTLSQITVGFQLGGQVYIEIIFFKDQTAVDDFMRGNFEMGAQVSAVAVTLGASADAAYNKGVAVFTIAEGGLMYEASIGGQKFKVKPR